jgi:hypothetical protein
LGCWVLLTRERLDEKKGLSAPGGRDN